MSELCPDCPLRRIQGIDTQRIVDSVRYSVDDPGDAKRIALHESAEAIAEALRLAGSDRCAKLAEAVPTAKCTKRGTPFAACAEVALAGALTTKEDEEAFAGANY